MLAHLSTITKLQVYRTVNPGSALHPAQAARKITDCGNWLVFAHYFNVDAVRLTRASFCKEHLLCPLCAIRRGSKLLRGYLGRFEAITARRPELKPYLLTATVKNGEDLGERFMHLQHAWRRCVHRRQDAKARSVLRGVEGGVASYEFTNRGNGWHPHLHAVILAASEPSGAGFAREWHETTGDSHIVDIRPFHAAQEPAEGFLEVFKYAVKFGDLSPALRWHAFSLLRGRRLLTSFGSFRGVEVPDELLDLPLDSEPYLELLYRYATGRGFEFQGARPPRAEDAPGRPSDQTHCMG